MRAVLDANVLISAFVYPRGRVAPVWRAALAQRYILVTSPEIVTELAEVLRRTFGWDGPRINRQLKRITRRAEIVSPRQTLHVIPEDPDDDRILECAVEGDADVIVSGDRHLRRLKIYAGIPIVRPVDFLRTLGEA